MSELIIQIDADKEPLIKELVKQLGGSVESKSGKKKSRLEREIKQAVKEMNDIKSGKKKARNADEFLNELCS